MDVGTLRKIKALRSKIKDIDDLIQASYSPVRSPTFSHFTRSSKNYSSPVERTLRRVERLKEIRSELIEEYYSILNEVEAWLETVEDGKAVSIIRLHFICCRTWKETAQIVNGNIKGETCRTYIYRFFKGHGIDINY